MHISRAKDHLPQTVKDLTSRDLVSHSGRREWTGGKAAGRDS